MATLADVLSALTLADEERANDFAILVEKLKAIDAGVEALFEEIKQLSSSDISETVADQLLQSIAALRQHASIDVGLAGAEADKILVDDPAPTE